MPDAHDVPEIASREAVAPGHLPAGPALARRPALHMLLFLASSYTMTLAGAGSEAGRLSLQPDSLAGALLSPSFVLLGLPYSLCLIAILGAHEMGHYLCCRLYGLDASLPYFLPGLPIPFGTFGAFIRIRSPFPDRNALFDVGAAGPIAGFLIAVPVLVYGIATVQPVPTPPLTGSIFETQDPLLISWLVEWLGPEVPSGHTIMLSGPLMAAWVGCLATFMNLLPIGQLDGGHICYAVSGRFHRAASLAGLVAFVAVGIFVFQGWLLFALLLVIIGPKHPPVLDEGVGLSPGRRVVAALTLVILILCFMPRPLSIADP